MNKLTLILTGLVVALPHFLPVQAAPNAWFNLHNRPGVSFELHSPSIDLPVSPGYGRDFSGWALISTVNIRARGNNHVILEIPVVRAQRSFTGNDNTGAHFKYGSTETAAGNPYVGMNWSRPGTSWIVETGVIVPSIERHESLPADLSATMFCDKREVFTARMLAMEFGLGYRDVDLENFVVRSMVRSTFQDAVFLDLQLDAAREFSRVFLQAGYIGRLRVNRVQPGDDRYGSQIMFAAGPRFDQLEAGVSVIFPLDEFYPYEPKYTWGLNLRYFFEPPASREFE